MSVRLAAIVFVAVLQLFAASEPAEAQRQKGKLGGGAGFAWLSDPNVDLGSTAIVGGYTGFRFNDNVSVEAGLYWTGADRVYNVFGVPLDDEPVDNNLPSFRIESNRYQADGTLVLNLGRRQPFHPFFLIGGGVQRREHKRTEFVREIEEGTGLDIFVPVVVADETSYTPNAIFGIGADIYFMYNLAARAEGRLWVPTSWDERTFAMFFSASYFF
jgi:hypothetical protein